MLIFFQALWYCFWTYRNQYQILFGNVHDIIVDFFEAFNCIFEFGVNRINSFGKGFTFCSSNIDIIKFVELSNGFGKIKNIMTSFKEVIKSNKKSICSQLPLSFSKAFVFEIGIFKLSADINCDLEFFRSLCWVTFQKIEDGCTRNKFSCLLNNCVTDFPNQNDQSCWRVVIFGVLPDQKNGMHDWNKEEMELGKILGCHKLIKPVFKNAHISVTIISFNLCLLNFLFEFFERIIVSTLTLQKELKDFLHLFWLKLLVDRV